MNLTINCRSARHIARRIARHFALAAVAAAMALSGGSGEAQADLLAHRAIYTLSIGAGSAATAGDGVMSYEIKDVCDGWAVDLKAELALATEDGTVHQLGWSQVTWEAKDGSRYRYFMRELTDRQETTRRRGEARRKDPGGPVDVIADLPERSEFRLPAEVLFPMQHTQALIAADAADAPYLLAQLFDGSVGDHAIEVGAALGPGGNAWRNPGKGGSALADQHSFPVDLAFFMGESPEGLPDTEQRLRLYANGVVAHLAFGLGDIEVQARLDEFRQLPPEGC